MNAEQTARQPEPDGVRTRVIVSLAKVTASVAAATVALFAAAGTLRWPMAWAYMAVALAGTAIAALLAPSSLHAERSGVPPDAKRWDIPLAVIMGRIGPIVTLGVAGLERRLRGDGAIPLWAQLAALAVAALGAAVGGWAMTANPFFSALVRVQTERGHRVIDSGPYRYVRHPGYAGSIAHILSAALALGSLWALIPAALTAGVIVVRTAREDATLQAELPGYASYAGRVPHRLLPGVW